jgi:hypothetical protein
MTRHPILDESFNPNKDIEKYLKDRFDGIYEQHKQFMTDEKPWSSDRYRHPGSDSIRPNYLCRDSAQICRRRILSTQ